MVDRMRKGQYYVYYLLGYLPYVLWYKLVCYCDLFYFAAAFYNNRRQPGNFFFRHTSYVEQNGSYI